MSDRFFSESPIQGNRAILTGQDASHLSKVLRARVGQEVIVFDGSGSEFLTRISHIGRHEVECDVLEQSVIDRELHRHIAIGVALPKGDRQRVLVEKLTELGVAELTPLTAERAVVQPQDQTLEKLRRAVIEASKQCGRNRLMAIADPRRPAEFFTAGNSSALRLVAHPRNDATDTMTLPSLARQNVSHVCAAIGPEGGFTEDEVRLASQSGWKVIDLGSRILRVETAAIVLAAVAGAVA